MQRIRGALAQGEQLSPLVTGRARQPHRRPRGVGGLGAQAAVGARQQHDERPQRDAAARVVDLAVGGAQVGRRDAGAVGQRDAALEHLRRAAVAAAQRRGGGGERAGDRQLRPGGGREGGAQAR